MGGGGYNTFILDICVLAALKRVASFFVSRSHHRN
jgi:hypothetical protein